MAQVVLTKIVKEYSNEIRAVDGIDLAIHDGEFLVMVGPSGCGKTTTLRMIAGLEDITSGTIHIGDRVVNDVSPKDRDVAMVFQSYALYPHKTVYENLAFGLKMRRVPREEIDRRVQEVAAKLDIVELLQRRPKELSGGQRQRVAVGRAIVREPSCFLLDEPLSNLDAKLRVATRTELKRLHRELRTTTVYVTHDQEEAMTLGERVAVFSAGKVQQCAAPLELYHRPCNRFVAEFLGTPTMSFFCGELVVADGLRFRGEGLELPLPKSVADGADQRVGAPVILGIRPEALSLEPPRGSDTTTLTLEALVDVVEPLGDLMDLYLSVGNEASVVARLKAAPVDESSRIQIHLDLDATHVFEPGPYGKNLALA